MASAGTVTVDFAAETAKFTAELKQVNSRLKKTEDSFSSLGKAAKLAFGAFSGAAILGFAKSAADAADELGKTADKLGLSTTALKSFQIAAGEAGVGLEQANKLLLESQKRLGEAATGTGEAAKYIKLLGLNVEDLQRLSPDELFSTYADSINSLSTRSEQLAAANALMGRSAQEAFAFIQAGSPALEDAAKFTERFGLALSRVEIKQIEQANDTIARIGTVSEAAGQRIAAGLAPALEFFANEILDATGNTKDLQTTIEQFGSVAIVAFEIVGNAARSLQAAFFGIAAGGARVLQFLTFGDVSESFGASVDANLAKANDALLKIKSIEEIQATVVKALEDSRSRAEAAVADQAARDAAAAAGGQTLSTGGIELSLQQQADVANDIARLAAEAQKEIQRDLTKSVEDELARRTDAYRNAAEYQVDLESRAQEAIRQQKQTTTAAALGLLQTLGAKNKAFAIAAIVLEKAIAIQRMLMANAVAAELAYASQLIPGDPTSLARAAAAKASVIAQGRIQAALIAATGAIQIASTVSDGAGANLGTPLNPITTRSAADQEFGATSQPVTQVVVNGNIFSSRETAEWFIEELRTRIDNNDTIIISPNSRQAQELGALNG